MYAKVFAQIYDGTLCTKGPWQAMVTFQQMLILADQEGNVDMTASAISRRTTIPLDIINLGIQELLLPDAESRTPTEEGRRIVPLSESRSWGWHIVNYKHYRALKREEDRRDYHRDYWHKRKANELNNSTTTQHTQPNQPIAEAKAEAKTISPKSARFAEFWQTWPSTERRTRKAECEKKWKAKGLDAIADQILAHVVTCKGTRKWQDGFEPAPMTYLNGRMWEDGDCVATSTEKHWNTV